MRLPLSTRIHEWLADRISWVQYPDVRRAMGYRPTLSDRWHRLSRAGKGWALLVAFWALLAMVSIWGNTLP